jgi:hypothetical protein
VRPISAELDCGNGAEGRRAVFKSRSAGSSGIEAARPAVGRNAPDGNGSDEAGPAAVGDTAGDGD